MGWREELEKNIIGLITAIVGIIAGVLTALYFYYASQKFRQITLRVDQVQIFDKSKVGELPVRLIDARGNVISENVFAASVVIWNSGNAEITKEAVREPFRVVVGDNVTPIDLSPTFYSNPYQGFHVSKDGGITWEHFDAGQGIKLRIVYVHNKQENIMLRGSANEVSRVNDLQEVKQRQTEANNLFHAEFALLGVGTVLSLVLLFFPQTRGVQVRRIVYINTSLWGFLWLTIIVLWLNFYVYGLPTPPF